MKKVKIRFRNDIAYLTIDDGHHLSINVDLLDDFKIYHSKKLSDENYVKLVELVKFSPCYTYGKHFADRGCYSSKEVMDKLKDKKYSQEEIDFVISKMTALNLINDEYFAKVFYDDVADIKLWGYGLVIYKLKEKQFSDEVIESIQINDNYEKNRAIKLTRQLSYKYKRDPNKRKKGKAIDKLVKNGFDYELSVEIVNQYIDTNSREEVLKNLEKEARFALAKYSKQYQDKKLRHKAGAYLLRRGYEFEDISDFMVKEFNL